MKALILTLATLLPLTAALPSQAQETPGRSRGPRGQHLARALNLTADQQTRIHVLRASHRGAVAPLRTSAQGARAALAQALQDPATPEATLRELHQKTSEAHFQLLLAGRANRAQVRALLTPEQREKASALRATHRERARGQMRRMRMRGGD